MLAKKYILPLFVLMVILQLLVPGQMIWDREQTIKHGSTVHLQTAPVDPIDPFRGKYVRLTFSNTQVDGNYSHLQRGRSVYAVLQLDANGVATPIAISTVRPSDDELYLKVKVQHSTDQFVRIEYPFDRYYMEESKAKPAEDLYRVETRSDRKAAMAVAKLRNGKAVLTDLMIEGRSIKELVEEQQSIEVQQ